MAVAPALEASPARGPGHHRAVPHAEPADSGPPVLALQRLVGNAALASMLAPPPAARSVQRLVRGGTITEPVPTPSDRCGGAPGSARSARVGHVGGLANIEASESQGRLGRRRARGRARRRRSGGPGEEGPCGDDRQSADAVVRQGGLHRGGQRGDRQADAQDARGVRQSSASPARRSRSVRKCAAG